MCPGPSDEIICAPMSVGRSAPLETQVNTATNWEALDQVFSHRLVQEIHI